MSSDRPDDGLAEHFVAGTTSPVDYAAMMAIREQMELAGTPHRIVKGADFSINDEEGSRMFYLDTCLLKTPARLGHELSTTNGWAHEYKDYLLPFDPPAAGSLEVHIFGVAPRDGIVGSLTCTTGNNVRLLSYDFRFKEDTPVRAAVYAFAELYRRELNVQRGGTEEAPPDSLVYTVGVFVPTNKYENSTGVTHFFTGQGMGLSPASGEKLYGWMIDGQDYDLFYYDSQTAYGAWAGGGCHGWTEDRGTPLHVLLPTPRLKDLMHGAPTLHLYVVAQVPKSHERLAAASPGYGVWNEETDKWKVVPYPNWTLSQSAYNVLTMLWYKPEGRPHPSQWWQVVDLDRAARHIEGRAKHIDELYKALRQHQYEMGRQERLQQGGEKSSCRNPKWAYDSEANPTAGSMYESVLQLWAYAAMAERFGIKLNAPTVTSIHRVVAALKDDRGFAEAATLASVLPSSDGHLTAPSWEDVARRLHESSESDASRQDFLRLLELLDVWAAAATHLSVPRCASSLPSRQSDVDRAIFADSASGGHWTLLRLVGKTAANTWTQTTRLSVGTMLAAAGRLDDPAKLIATYERLKRNLQNFRDHSRTTAGIVERVMESLDAFGHPDVGPYSMPEVWRLESTYKTLLSYIGRMYDMCGQWDRRSTGIACLARSGAFSPVRLASTPMFLALDALTKRQVSFAQSKAAMVQRHRRNEGVESLGEPIHRRQCLLRALFSHCMVQACESKQVADKLRSELSMESISLDDDPENTLLLTDGVHEFKNAGQKYHIADFVRDFAFVVKPRDPDNYPDYCMSVRREPWWDYAVDRVVFVPLACAVSDVVYPSVAQTVLARVDVVDGDPIKPTSRGSVSVGWSAQPTVQLYAQAAVFEFMYTESSDGASPLPRERLVKGAVMQNREFDFSKLARHADGIDFQHLRMSASRPIHGWWFVDSTDYCVWAVCTNGGDCNYDGATMEPWPNYPTWSQRDPNAAAADRKTHLSQLESTLQVALRDDDGRAFVTTCARMYKVYKMHELLKYGQDQASTLHMGWKKLPLRLRPNGHTLLPVEVALWAGAYECAAFASTDDEADVLENQPPGRYTLHEDARILQTALCVATLDPDGFFRAQFARTLLPRYIPDSLAAADEEGGSTIFDVAAGRLTAHDFLEETVTAQAMCNLFDVLLGGRSVRNSKGASTSKRGARFVYAGEPTSPMDGVQKACRTQAALH